MNFIHRMGLFPALLLLAASCQKPLFPDKNNNENKAKWENIGYKPERIIQHLHATPFELFAISENQFVRFDGNIQLLEKRPLDVAFGVRGIPAVSDNSFVRMTVDNQARQIVEFHLARNPAQIIQILADTLRSEDDSYLEVEFLARTLGAFSGDGTLFLLPAKVFPGRYYAFFMFEVVQNAAHNAFTSVKVTKRVNVLDMTSDFNNLVNIRFLDGNFYVTSREGAWRITPSGQVKKLFSQWMRDVFSRNGNLYMTGLSSFDLHESSDNGLTWKRLNINSELKMVETAGNLLFTQEVLGNPYLLMPEDFLKAQSIVYPKDASTDFSAYFSVAFFKDRYYFSIEKDIFSTSEVVTE
mgnify:CR=1 FL=1